MFGFPFMCHLSFGFSIFNISLTQFFISTHREHLRSGNEHALKEALHRPLKGTVQDEASPGGGVGGDVVPQPQVDIWIVLILNCMNFYLYELNRLNQIRTYC